MHPVGRLGGRVFLGGPACLRGFLRRRLAIAPQVPDAFNKKAFLPMGTTELRETSNLECLIS